MPKCKACGLEISFQRTKKGALMPCSPSGVYYKREPSGSDILTAGGELIKGRTSREYFKGASIGYIPHWAICPEEIKKRQRAATEQERVKTEQQSLLG
jgi:hypothetical protein